MFESVEQRCAVGVAAAISIDQVQNILIDAIVSLLIASA